MSIEGYGFREELEKVERRMINLRNIGIFANGIEAEKVRLFLMRFSLFAKRCGARLPLALVALLSAMVVTVALGTPSIYAAGGGTSTGGGVYDQDNLVSDIPGVANFTDPNLVNSWGIAHGPTGPWFVVDNGTGVATAYQGNGRAFPVGKAPLVITIPPPPGSPAGTTSAPTGIVFNSSDDFVISQGKEKEPSQFIFDTEDGTISGWNPEVDATHAIIAVNRSQAKQGTLVGAVYKGLAIGQVGKENFLYATNFRFSTVEMFDEHFGLVRSFTDKQLANTCPFPGQCFAPFGIQNINGNLYVTFALQNKDKDDDVAGAGLGFVDVFDTNGNLTRRLISRGQLNAPWGLALAPNNFGKFSNDLLIGNFGDGHLNAFDPKTGAFLGQPTTEFGNPISIDGLWGLGFGNGGLAGPTNTLFFAAGIADEEHGLFGSIEPED
jgi:uncharacterized protein (TIGR03118 family)